jgi:lycopene beta-cyclase
MGAGPAALCITSELVQQGLDVQAIASKSPLEPWPNTYGIWASELESLNMQELLKYRWKDTVSFFGDGLSKDGNACTNHYLDYGLFNLNDFQEALLDRCNGLSWQIETVEKIDFSEKQTVVICSSGKKYLARLVIDASGHKTPFIKRPQNDEIAKQAAYGVVGKFSSPPVEKNRFVLMDFRPDHLDANQLREPPSFLYAMDLGDGSYFVEETSLACAPPVSFEALKTRLNARLSSKGIQIEEIIHEEHCLFPMNLPLPHRDQPLLAFGGSASMVHPASGYMVGSLLRRAPSLAREIAKVIKKDPFLPTSQIARRGWQNLWTTELVQRHRLYQFGLQRLMSFDESLLRSFFYTFFKLPKKDWYGYLTNTLPLPRLFIVMLKLFSIAPSKVRLGMLGLIIKKEEKT